MKELKRVIGLQMVWGDHKGILGPLLVFPEVCPSKQPVGIRSFLRAGKDS